MRKLIGSLVILALILVGLDFGARVYAESWIAGQLQKSLAVSEKPSVTIGGVLFLPEVLSGHVSSATVKGTTFSAKGIHFEEFTLNLNDVRFSSAGLLVRHHGTIRAASGNGSLGMTAGDITAAFASRGIPLTVTFASGRIELSAGNLPPGLVSADASIQAGELVLKPVSPPVPITFRLPLPPVVHRLTYRSLRIEPSGVVLTFTLANAVFVVPKPSSTG